ncbi:MAG: hypothetical protein HYY84_09305 [Deltaproteobacteria bacterium]|nr:hypothetical protein [Deltaproteobacteria bacterium]
MIRPFGFWKTSIALIAIFVATTTSFVHAQTKSKKKTAGALGAATASAASAAGKGFETWRGKFAKGDGDSKLGDLVAISKIMKAYKEKVAAGEAMPGEKEPNDLADVKCPNPQSPGPDCVPPLEDYRGLLPGLYDYVGYIWERVLDDLNKPEEKKRQIVSWLFNYGCRQIARHMPGFARIVKVTRRAGASMYGDWDAKVDDADREKMLGRKAAKAGGAAAKTPAPYSPPPKDEVVEICTVTHLQLEKTLTKDLRILVDDRIKSTAKATLKDPEVIGGAKLTTRESIVDLAKKAPGWKDIKLADGKGLGDAREVDPKTTCGSKKVVNPGEAGNKDGHFPSCKDGDDIDMPDWDKVCREKFGDAAGARLDAVFSSTSKKVNCAVAADEKARVADEHFSDLDLSDADPTNPAAVTLKGETYASISNRLLGFFRKGGKARVMVETNKKIAKKVKLRSSPKGMAESVKKQNESGEKVAWREGFKRQVDQWTDAYEYGQLINYLSTDPELKKSKVLASYQAAEAVIYNRFWNDCTETWDICQNPKLKIEQEACVKCAYKTLLDHCADGDRDGDTCKSPVGKVVPEMYWAGIAPNWASKREPDTTKIKDTGDAKVPEFSVSHAGGATVRNVLVGWLGVMKGLIGAPPLVGTKGFANAVIPAGDAGDLLIDRRFLPFGSPDAKQWYSRAGILLLDQMPLTAWQKCYLWTGKMEKTCNLLNDKKPKNEKKMKDMLKAWAKDNVPAKNPLIKLVSEHKTVKDAKQGNFMLSMIEGAAFGRREDDLKSVLGISNDSDKGDMGAVADKMMDLAAPIIGKVIGMLLNAPGMRDTMKMLAKAAGLTPEQAIDCESAEYRQEQIGIAAKSKLDNKRGCLTKVFAKNFVNVLEAIIVMLGNKLVDWAVEMLDVALMAAKLALVSAAGSVPFAGGVLATLVEVVWYVLFKFGAPALLKGLVVSELPKWLKIKELAGADLEKMITEHPIISAISGIILQSIDAAIQYGDKGPLEIGFGVALEAIEEILIATKQNFWLRVFIEAKKELVTKPAKEGTSLIDQVKGFVEAMIVGFGKSIEMKLTNPRAREMLAKAIDSIKALVGTLTSGADAFTKDPIKFLMEEVLAKRILPAAMPILTAFVDLPNWAKDLLIEAGEMLAKLVQGKGQLKFADMKDQLKSVLTALKDALLEKLPSGDALTAALNTMLTDTVSIIDDVKGFVSKYVWKPKAILQKLASIVGPLVTTSGLIEKLGGSLAAPELAFLKSAVGEFFTLLGDPARLGALVAAAPAKVEEILKRLVKPAKEYALARIKAALAGTGLDVDATFNEVVAPAVTAILDDGPDGLFAKGKAFVDGAAAKLKDKAITIATTAANGLLAVVRKRIEDFSQSPLVTKLTTDGVLKLLVDQLKQPDALNKLKGLDQGKLIALAKGALAPVVTAIADAVPEPTLKPAVTNVLNAIVASFDNPSQLVTDGATAWGKLTKKVEADLRVLMKAAIAKVTPAAMVDEVVRAVDLTTATASKEMVITVVLFFIEKAGAPIGVVATLRTVVQDVVGYIAEPAKLDALIKGAKAALMTKLMTTARALVNAVKDQLFRATDPFRPVVEQAIAFVTDIYERGLPTPDQIGTYVKEKLAGLADELFKFARAKVAEIVNRDLAPLKGIVLDAFDSIHALGIGILGKVKAAGKNAWDEFVGAATDAKAMVAKLVEKLLPIVENAIAGATTFKPAVEFVKGIAKTIVGILKDGKKLASVLKDEAAAAKTLLADFATNAVETFIQSAFVDRLSGAGKTIATFFKNAVVTALKNIDDLKAFIEKFASSKAEDLKTLAKGLVTGLVGGLVAELKKSAATLGAIVEKAVSIATSNFDQILAK